MPFILFSSCKLLQFVHFALFTLTAHNYSSRENGTGTMEQRPSSNLKPRGVSATWALNALFAIALACQSRLWLMPLSDSAWAAWILSSSSWFEEMCANIERAHQQHEEMVIIDFDSVLSETGFCSQFTCASSFLWSAYCWKLCRNNCVARFIWLLKWFISKVNHQGKYWWHPIEQTNTYYILNTFVVKSDVALVAITQRLDI